MKSVPSALADVGQLTTAPWCNAADSLTHLLTQVVLTSLRSLKPDSRQSYYTRLRLMKHWRATVRRENSGHQARLEVQFAFVPTVRRLRLQLHTLAVPRKS